MFNLKNLFSGPLHRKITVIILVITALAVFPIGGGLLGLLQSFGIPIGFATPILGPFSFGFILSLLLLWIVWRLGSGRMM